MNSPDLSKVILHKNAFPGFLREGPEPCLLIRQEVLNRPPTTARLRRARIDSSRLGKES